MFSYYLGVKQELAMDASIDMSEQFRNSVMFIGSYTLLLTLATLCRLKHQLK